MIQRLSNQVQLQQNNAKKSNGFSIIMVIVAMAFVGVLVAVIMLASLYNYYTKATNRMAKDNFYTAETALEEIRSGLQIEVDKAFNVAYMSVFQEYTSNLTEKNSRFGKIFCSTLIKSLEETAEDGSIVNSSEKKFNLEKISGYVTKLYDEDADVGAEVTGISVDGNKENDRNALVEYTDGVRLEGVQITYHDEKGYVSIIATDILLKVPNLDLINPIIVPPLEDYALIANTNLEITSNAGKDVTIAGGVYGGAEGITIARDKGLTIKRADFQYTSDIYLHSVYANTDGDIDVGGAGAGGTADFTIGPGVEVWANAINTFGGNLKMGKLPGQISAADLYDSGIYLHDDLTLRGSGNNVDLSGRFYGFGYMINGAENSSGIVINGTKTAMDLSGLTTLKLAGNTYIATSQANNNTLAGETNPKFSENDDVRTGSSVTSKGEQMAYLVPPEYIGWLGDECVLGTNPVSEADYNIYKDRMNFEPVKESANIRYKPIYVRTTKGSNWIYFYMRFDSVASANSYFADYFNSNKSKMNSYIKNYIDSLELNPDLEKGGLLNMYLAGNMITGSRSDYELIQYTSTNLEDNSKINEEFAEYNNQFNALNRVLRKGYKDITPMQRGNSVYANVVKESAIANILSTASDLYFYEEGATNPIALVTKNDYTWNGTDSGLHLIICDKNVTVTADFQGLIIAKGTITIDKNVTVSAYDLLNTAMMAETRESNYFLSDEQSGEVKQHMPLYFLVEGQEKEDLVGKEITDTTYTSSDFVIYENWTKQ